METVLKAAFLFVAPGADPDIHCHWVKTPKVHLAVVGAGDYARAAGAAKKLVAEEGVAAIELCAGFGNKGVAMICDAVGEKIPVGVVRFDTHPGLGNVSGDAVFS